MPDKTVVDEEDLTQHSDEDEVRVPIHACMHACTHARVHQVHVYLHRVRMCMCLCAHAGARVLA